MIVVSGKIYVQPDAREEFITRSLEAVKLARLTDGCRDFVVAADPVEVNRVNVYEEWESVDALNAFRGDGPGDDLLTMISRADVHEYEALPLLT